MKASLIGIIVLWMTCSVYGQDLEEVSSQEALMLLRKQIVTAAKENTAQLMRLKNQEVELLIRLGQYNEAQKSLDSLSKVPHEKKLKAITLTNVGFLQLHRGAFDAAVQSLKEASQLLDQIGESKSLEAAQIMSILGQVYTSTDKNVLAEQQLTMALNVRRTIVSEDHELIAASYNDLGLAFAKTNSDKALEYYERALAIYRKLHSDDHPKIAIAYSNIGYIYREDKLYGDAVNYFEDALKIWSRLFPNAHPAKAFVLFNLGKTYSEMSDEKAAHAFFVQSLNMYVQSYGEKHPEIANVHNAMATLELSSRRFSSAILHVQNALAANTQDFDPKDINAIPSIDRYYNGNVLLYSMLLKAEALEAQYFGKTLRFKDLDLALSHLNVCDRLVDQLRQRITNESDKISLGAIASDVYAAGVRISVAAADVALHKTRYRESAFYFAEKSKSAVLLEAIAESDAKSFAGIPAALLVAESEMKASIALTAQRLAQKPDVEEEKRLRELQFEQTKKYEQFVHGLEQQFPEYFDLKYNAASPSIEALQSLINASTAVISYFADERNERLYQFVITRNSFDIYEQTIPPDFEKNITGLRNALYYNANAPYVKASNALSRILLPRVPSRIKSLVIIPTGRMSVLPFEALFIKTARIGTPYSQLPYLIKDFDVRYEFSAALLSQKTKKQTTSNRSILLCAPVDFPSNGSLSSLPGTEREVRAISKLFADLQLQHKVLAFADATEQSVKMTDLKTYGIVHFATHGMVDEKNPELSRIYLRDQDNEDGSLYAGEIFNLEMNASLVTLSACQTGLGKISKGEGVIGLSRALVYAGARNVVVSFWNVSDESTSSLMQNFYSNILQIEQTNNNYAANLRKAKNELLKDDTHAAPFYWAAFILIGF